ncbi:hypothetical protein CB1_000262008 [Camelus ferus]|nr:hypothetical protein CB1_000262008 [Camelus ferus]
MEETGFENKGCGGRPAVAAGQKPKVLDQFLNGQGAGVADVALVTPPAGASCSSLLASGTGPPHPPSVPSASTIFAGDRAALDTHLSPDAVAHIQMRGPDTGPEVRMVLAPGPTVGRRAGFQEPTWRRTVLVPGGLNSLSRAALVSRGRRLPAGCVVASACCSVCIKPCADAWTWLLGLHWAIAGQLCCESVGPALPLSHTVCFLHRGLWLVPRRPSGAGALPDGVQVSGGARVLPSQGS